ncbi:hypothetical protein PCORN_17574 [Listeria cornellensis FSL F6-0969]|uniref:Uncharacterized protein n=1 Tax=Listeria cornellensis FSL F6-0969 TaxID=1265820 RepID=W7BHM0_9LIST|nr:hypothetical protein PCORN_17574 [Listeria cornellensis FSL F6-0969]
MKFSRSWLKGRQSHFMPLHIEVLKKLNTLSKNHNKAGSGGAAHGLHGNATYHEGGCLFFRGGRRGWKN